MKRITRLLWLGGVWLLILWSPAANAFAAPPDSLSRLYGRTDSMKKTIDTVRGKMDGLTVNVKAIKDSMSAKKDCGCVPDKTRSVEPLGWLLVFLPALLFAILLVVVVRSGLKEFSLKNALSENEFPTIIKANPLYNATVIGAPGVLGQQNLSDTIPPTIEKTYIDPKTNEPALPSASISRYIAFISSVLTLVVALGIACFYIYYYIRTTCPPDLSGVSTLLIALGIGVLPYAFNKMSTAIGKNKDE